MPPESSRLPFSLVDPIGVFDSGVGGLTVLKALHERLPHRDLIYVADTARVPYGRKPPAMVQEFAREITNFLVDLGVCGVVIACNTASAAALPQLEDEVPVPVWGVIAPGVEAARNATRTGRVGVIGTKGAIASGAYQRRLEAQGLTVWSRACPMFVHLVEEGLADSPEAAVLAHHYLADHPDIDTLILGCTHYPLLRDTLARELGPGVQLVESAGVAAGRVAAALGDSEAKEPGRIVHFITGDIAAYHHTAQAVGGVGGEFVSLPVTELALVAL